MQATATSSTGPKKSRGSTEEEEDLTQGMDNPTAEPRIVEVVAAPSNSSTAGAGGNSIVSNTSSSKKDNELQPLKCGNMADLDEPNDGMII